MFNYSLNMGSLMGTLWGLTHFCVDASSGHSRNCSYYFFFVSCFSALVLSYLSICLDYNKNNS